MNSGAEASSAYRVLIALGLAVVSFVLVLVAQRDNGIVRDEVHYMNHGDRYASWWIDLVSGKDDTASQQTITAHFGGKAATANNREHPPFMKTLFGLSHLLFHKKLGWTSRITAYRLPTAAMNALLVALVFLFASGVWGRGTGVVAALLTLLLPRAFFHAGLATFDAPIVAMWFATLSAYYRALSSRWWWCVVFGVCLGLALATKHNAVLLPVALLCHYGWVAARQAKGEGAGAMAMSVLTMRPLMIPAMAVLAPLVLIAIWPWLWFDTVDHIGEWLAFHMNHVHYNFEYLGKNWNAPPFPWHVPIVTTALTVPVATLIAGIVGAGALAVRALRDEAAQGDCAPALLLFLSAGVSMGPFVLGSTPIFGAEKHWAPAIPTICIYAGVGVMFATQFAVRELGAAGFVRVTAERTVEVAASAVLAALVVAAAAAETSVAQPYALTHYNALAGGVAGGADLGMNRQFWGYAARGVLPFLNDLVPDTGAPLRVYTHDASPTWGLYRSAGLVSRRVQDSGREDQGVKRSSVALVIHERHFNRHDYMIWAAYGTVQPAFVLTTGGVPIVSVYVRPASVGQSEPKQ